jgi:hypothetical protein
VPWFGQRYLSTNDLHVGQVLSYWQASFKLHCDNKDQFYSFHSKAKKGIYKPFPLCLLCLGYRCPEVEQGNEDFPTVLNKTT